MLGQIIHSKTLLHTRFCSRRISRKVFPIRYSIQDLYHSTPQSDWQEKMNETVAPILRDVPTELVGETIILRAYQQGDGVSMWEAIEESREHHLPWIPWGDSHKVPEISEQSVRKMQVKWMLREDLPFGIWDRKSGIFLGGINLNRIRWDVPSVELGYWLRKSAEGHGYMTEALKLVCRLAFEKLEFSRIEIQIAAGNSRSIAVPKRVGFVHEGTLRHSGRSSTGELVDMMIFAMVRADYEAPIC